MRGDGGRRSHMLALAFRLAVFPGGESVNRNDAIEQAARAVWNSFREFELPYNGREWESLIGLRNALDLPPLPAQEEPGATWPGDARRARDGC